MSALNATHDPSLSSWVPAANRPGADFPVQNLPFGVFRTGPGDDARCGVAIGDQVLDVRRIADLVTGDAAGAARACAAPVLNALMALAPEAVSALRAQLSVLLSAEARRSQVAPALVPLAQVELQLPVRVAGYTDFFASIHHASNAGRLFRPDQPLLPNYKHVPVAYNGRANSVRVSGQPVLRPQGQQRPVAEGGLPAFGPSDRLDHEVELGMLIGRSTQPGRPVPVGAAWAHVFGFCLLNDWSARDIQAWEYQPLGPFLGKSFATSVSSWVVTAEALAPFRTAAAPRPARDPAPLPYLWDADDQAAGAVAIRIDAHLSSARMRAQGLPAHRLSRSDAATLYWTPAQMVAHHTSNGCALDTADLLGSGTVSGASEDALGSLLEITRGGTQPLRLPSGEERRFLLDGDEVVLTGHCEGDGAVRIGFGECRARVLPSIDSETNEG
ncbi:fumarylacetoacetase [uncultured Pseudacidovorax sp.]|uniref:fumarylacetoacetase n=1 Tax=uncultured Pseudacidovorax sp. TaxID=679313 RepID=UPI0025EF4789|nr:fumarylacetoacetase [uncultured Pseudacidovorax sp.]